jgi:hypothetical protein
VKTRSIFIAFVVVVIAVAGVLLMKKNLKVNKLLAPSVTPTIQQKIESKFLGLNIPTDAERAELKDVSGGSGIGLATRTEILADLPDPPKGQFYQARLEKDGKTVLIGNLKIAKGGWMISYNSEAYPGYNKVIVMLGDTHILEGSF